MDIEKLLQTMTPDVYSRLLYGVETGRWPDGAKLSLQQKEQAMQLVMLYQSRHNDTPDHMTISTCGDIVFKTKQELKQDFSTEGLIAKFKINDKE